MGQFPLPPSYPVDLSADPGSGILVTRQGTKMKLAIDPAGIGGAGTSIQSGEAGAAINPFRAVRSTSGRLFQALASDATHFATVVGISLTQAAIGDDLDYVAAGRVDAASWNWSLGPVYLAADGSLTQVYPSSPAAAFLQQVGVATLPTRIIVALAAPILLAA